MSSLDTMLGMFNVSDNTKPPAEVDFSPQALRAAIKEEEERPPRMSLSKSMDIGRSMYEKGVQKLQQKEEKLKEIRSSDCSFRPTLNRNSLSMVKSPRKRREEAVEDPIQEETPKPKFSDTEFLSRNYVIALETFKKRRERRRTPSSEKVDQECTFVPKINPQSKQLQGNNLFQLKAQQDIKLQGKIKEREEKKAVEEMKECTFAPQLKKRIKPKTNVPVQAPVSQRQQGYSYRRTQVKH